MSTGLQTQVKATPTQTCAPALTGLLQYRATNQAEPSTVPPIVHEVLRSPGQPLDAATRAFMEPRFGHDFHHVRVHRVDPEIMHSQLSMTQPGHILEEEADRMADAVSRLPRSPVASRPPSERAFSGGRLGHDFSQVRVHTDGQAAEAARAVHAEAFTLGHHIVFGTGRFANDTRQGLRLLAHELAHTAQPGSERRLARQPVTGYETAPVQVERADIEKLVGVSYWEQKVTAQYAVTFINTVQSRFKADPEERDAVLSVLWQRRPKSPITAATLVTVSIPPRAGTPASKALLYQFTFTPAPKGGQEGVGIELKAEASQAVVSAAPAPPAGYTPPSFSRNASDFPDGIDNYFKAHPEEHKQLYSWIENAPPKFEQIVTTSETTPKGKKHDSTYQVQGTKDAKGKLTSLDIHFLSETPTFIDNPPAGYASKDFADVELEKAQAKASDKLGQVNGLATLPTEEQLSVKYVIWQYFAGGTRNKEVDVIIPIAKQTKRVFYTLRFRPVTNNVDVERVGEESSSVKLTATALKIDRVEGFTANSSDPTTFKTWLSKRYPAVTPQGTTLAELQDSVNKEMEAKAGTPEWFKKNYNIEILDATAAAPRLQTVHQLLPPQTVDLKAFTTEELKRLEFALETMSDAELQIVKGTQMARQNVLIELKGTAKTPTPDPKTPGITWQKGTEKTIIIFDSAAGNEQSLFAGGAAGVRPSSVQTYVHEFGHVLAEQAKLEKPFNDFVKKKGIKPITWYAASKPVTESFPEAFALYQTDPEWMQDNLPELFAWFEAVKKTGKPPATP